jgi:plasmid stability protein
MATLNIKNFSDRLYKKLQARARKQHRSMAQEVTHLLEQAITEAEELSILELRGLGRHLWQGVDPVAHVAEERRSWD